MIIQMCVVLNSTAVDSDSHFDNVCSNHLQSQSEFITRQLVVLNSGNCPDWSIKWQCCWLCFCQSQYSTQIPKFDYAKQSKHH